jgi:hypothetical protein
MAIGPKPTEEVATLDMDFTESTFLKTDTLFVQKVRVLSNFVLMVFPPIWPPSGTFELRAPRGVLPKIQNFDF